MLNDMWSNNAVSVLSNISDLMQWMDINSVCRYEMLNCVPTQTQLCPRMLSLISHHMILRYVV